MNYSKLISNVVSAYCGYPKSITVPKDILVHLGKLTVDESENIFRYIIDTVVEKNPFVLEQYTLSLGHFLAINNKQDNFDSLVPEPIKKNLGKNFDKIKNIIYAAGRVYQVLFNEIIGTSESIMWAKKRVWQACFGADLTKALYLEKTIRQLHVHLCGETGVGKELFAKVLQVGAFWNGNGEAPSTAINISALSPNLIESELFGHKKAAFTGATSDKDGLLQSAHGGTFFLDEIGDLPPDTQIRLLRVIETKKVRKVGAGKNDLDDADVRYISATHKDIKADFFRQDLYQRLACCVISIPPLRARSSQDIERIAGSIFNASFDSTNDIMSFEMIKEKLIKSKTNYHWPGNVRELISFIRNSILEITPIGNQPDIVTSSSQVPNEIMEGKFSEKEMIKWYTRRVYELTGNNWTRTAQILRRNIGTLIRRRGIIDEEK